MNRQLRMLGLPENTNKVKLAVNSRSKEFFDDPTKIAQYDCRSERGNKDN